MVANRNQLIGLLCLLALMGTCPPARAQEDPAPAKDGAVRALEERLKALEAEEKNLEALAAELAEGRDVRSADLYRHWVPSAVYFQDEKAAEDPMGIAGAAADLTKTMLDEKDVELERLLELRSSVEAGDSVEIDRVESAETMGLSGREKMLNEHEDELSLLRGRLDSLRFQDRFNRSADLTADLGGTERHLLPQGELPAVEDDDAPAESKSTPSIAVNLLTLAETCYRSGQIQKAREVFEQIDTAAHPQGDRIVYMIARCLERQNDLEAARQSYDDFLRIYPESFWAPQAKFARSMVDWKLDLGPIEGAPAEISRVLPGPADERNPRGN